LEEIGMIRDITGRQINRGDFILVRHKNEYFLALCYGFKKNGKNIKIYHSVDFASGNPKDVIKLDDEQLNYFVKTHNEDTDDFEDDMEVREIMLKPHTPEFDEKKDSWIYHRIYENGRIKSYDENGFAIMNKKNK
jgi:hypothetical protein